MGEVADTRTLLLVDPPAVEPLSDPNTAARFAVALRRAIVQHDGTEVLNRKARYLVAFSSSAAAVMAAHQIYQAIADLELPVPPRLALHSGPTQPHVKDYAGSTFTHLTYLLEAGYAGQVLLSATVAGAVLGALPADCSLQDLGEHYLKDLAPAVHIYQLVAPNLAEDFPPLRTLDRLPHNLPAQSTNFIGREQEMATIKQLLLPHHLLTLIGAGGVGKTRLALQVAADVADHYRDGVWLAELAPIGVPDLVSKLVADALGVDEQPGRPTQDTLCEYLADKQLLLLLDNCEHLLTATSALVGAIMAASREVSILASSREPLTVAAATNWRVPSLPAPAPRYDEAVAKVAAYPAVRLLLDRVAAVQPTFRLNAQNAAAVGQICHRLDGIPLALELAAAQMLVLKPQQIAAQLDNRFRLLSRGSRTALPRQQTLRALVDWSYDLLDPTLQVLLQRLSVFAGTWTVEAAGVVCAGGIISAAAVPDLLRQLENKSLSVSEERGAANCYRMLETIRQYAQEKLFESGGAAAAHHQHAAYYVQLAAQAEPHLKGVAQAIWLKRLEDEHDNLRAALRWSLGQQPTLALHMAGTLARFWQYHGHLNEGWQWLQAALSNTEAGDEVARAKALTGAGNMAWWRGDYDVAQTLHQAALSLREQTNDRAGIANSLVNLGNLASVKGESEASYELYLESLALFRELDDQWSIAQALNNIGNVFNERGDYAKAGGYYEQSLSIYRALGDKWAVALALDNLGALAYQLGNYAAAGDIHRESLRLFREVEGKRGIAYALVGLGRVAMGVGGEQQTRRAVRLLIAGASLFGAINAALDPEYRTEYEAVLASGRNRLDPAVFTALQREGEGMELSQAIDYALAEN